MFRADLTPVELTGVLHGEPRDVILVGTMLGRYYHAELYLHGLSVGVGTSMTSAVSSIIEALEDRQERMKEMKETSMP